MSDSKIQIKVGIVEFSGEGNQEWLSQQLDKILLRVPELLKIELANPPKQDQNDRHIESKKKNSDIPKNLATFLKDKSATTNQTRKFLATAAFLQLGGKSRLTTTDISKSLKDSNQSRLGNPSETLNGNIKKGFCERDGNNGFFVTYEGFSELDLDVNE